MSEDLVKVEVEVLFFSRDPVKVFLPEELVRQRCIWLKNGRCALDEIQNRGSVECVGGLDCEPAVPSFRVPMEMRERLGI